METLMDTRMNDELKSASELLARLRIAFASTCAQLAQHCARGGELDAAALDREQVASYALALASAELFAAESALASAAQASELDRRLALTFAVEAVPVIVEQLCTVRVDLGAELIELQSVSNGPALLALRRAVTSGAALSETGRALIDHPAEIAHVSLDEHLQMAQDSFRRVAADAVAPLAEKIHRHDLTVPEELLQPLREMGVFGLSIPSRFGGSGPDDHDDNLMMIVVTEALSEASLAAGGSLITRPEILSRALMAGGTQAQKERWLPRIAAGDPLCAIAITEPDFGSDVASLALKGTKVDGGWLLDGAKTWCTFAGKAGLIMVVTRTNPDRKRGHKGLSILLVEKPSFEGHAFTVEQDGGGRLTGSAIPTIGYRGMHSFDLSFHRYFVPDANLIGEQGGEGRGFYYTMAGMLGGRMQTAARASGVMRAALSAALRYAQDRKVFGAPLAHYPLTLAKLARMAARYAACRQMTYAVGRKLDAGTGGAMDASLAKLIACRSAELVTREALQIHGGMGYAEETAVSRYFVDARVLSIFEGAEETLALKVIARTLLEDALKARAA